MNNPTFVQEYTNEVRRFTIRDDGTNLSIDNYSAWRDTTELHRRDYNMLPQVFPNGERGFTMFSGVFQHLVDLPWLNTVDLTPSGYTPVAGFSQYLSQYHSAKAALWDSSTNTMHSLFFGGISRYTLDTATGTLLDDPNVPFVRTISRVTRYPDGAMTEYAFPETMPVLTGSGAEFFPVESLPMDEQEILRLDLLPVGETVIGHIVGGIESSQPNIFFINTGWKASRLPVCTGSCSTRRSSLPSTTSRHRPKPWRSASGRIPRRASSRWSLTRKCRATRKSSCST